MNVSHRRHRTFLCLAAALTVVDQAHGSGVDTYPAPVAGADLLFVERAHPRSGRLQPFGRLSLAYANDPLVVRRDDGTESKIVAHQGGAYASVGVTAWGRAHAAFLLPLHAQSGVGLDEADDLPTMGFGDLALDLRAAVLTRDDPLEVALGTRLELPTGSEEGLVSDGHTTLGVKAMVSRELDVLDTLLTGSLGTKFREDRDVQGVDTSSSLALALGGVWSLNERWGLSCEGSLETQYDRLLAATATPATLLAGVRMMESRWVAHVGAGPGITRGIGTPDFRVIAMVGSIEPVETSRESAVLDADRDGIADVNDACVAKSEDRDGFRDDDGCPEPDDDADGIVDVEDACREAPEDVDGFADQDGCPESDDDTDGVKDDTDACRLVPEDRDGFRDEDGCPEDDDDGDGVADPSDQCPHEQESPNGIKDDDGCPDLLVVEQAQIRTLEPIYFRRGRAEIEERSLPLLDEMASVVASRVDLGTIAIEGHTDDIGSERFNLDLSQRRAEAVRAHLIARGVPEARLTARGYGEAQPMESNETKEGRERNRRVEFRFQSLPDATDATHQGKNP